MKALCAISTNIAGHVADVCIFVHKRRLDSAQIFIRWIESCLTSKKRVGEGPLRGAVPISQVCWVSVALLPPTSCPDVDIQLTTELGE